MKTEIKRVPTQIHTRKLDRSVAHKNMERAKLRRVNKHDYVTYYSMTGMPMQERVDSYFAKHWRDTVNVPTIDLRRKNA